MTKCDIKAGNGHINIAEFQIGVSSETICSSNDYLSPINLSEVINALRDSERKVREENINKLKLNFLPKEVQRLLYDLVIEKPLSVELTKLLKNFFENERLTSDDNPLLENILKIGDPKSRMIAIALISFRGVEGSEALSALTSIITPHHNPKTRDAALQAILRIDPDISSDEALVALVNSLDVKNRNSEIQKGIINKLFEILTPERAQRIIDRYDNDTFFTDKFMELEQDQQLQWYAKGLLLRCMNDLSPQAARVIRELDQLKNPKLFMPLISSYTQITKLRTPLVDRLIESFSKWLLDNKVKNYLSTDDYYRDELFQTLAEDLQALGSGGGLGGYAVATSKCLVDALNRTSSPVAKSMYITILGKVDPVLQSCNDVKVLPEYMTKALRSTETIVKVSALRVIIQQQHELIKEIISSNTFSSDQINDLFNIDYGNGDLGMTALEKLFVINPEYVKNPFFMNNLFRALSHKNPDVTDRAVSLLQVIVNSKNSSFTPDQSREIALCVVNEKFEQDLRIKMAHILFKMGKNADEAVPVLKAHVLNTRGAIARAVILNTLVEIDPNVNSYSPYLLEALNDQKENVRNTAIKRILALPSGQNNGHLERILREIFGSGKCPEHFSGEVEKRIRELQSPA